MASWKDLMDINYSGINKEVVTVLLAAAIVVADIGKPVKVSADNTVDLAAVENPFPGVLDQVDPSGGLGALQYCGPVTVPYTGAPALNRQELVANGAGGVKPPAVAGTGRMYFVLNIDETAGTITFLLT
jgi:hypothetical protein